MSGDEKQQLSLKSLCLLAALCLSGCSIEGGIKSLRSEKPLHDFLKSEILDTGAVPADGVSQLYVLVHLKNSDSSVVKDFVPTYEITNGTGVVPSECSASSDQGVAVCALKASVPGLKRFHLTNARVGLERDVRFDIWRRGRQLLGVTSGSVVKGSTPGGHQVQLSAGAPSDQIKGTTSRGYEVFFSVQGQISTAGN